MQNPCRPIVSYGTHSVPASVCVPINVPIVCSNERCKMRLSLCAPVSLADWRGAHLLSVDAWQSVHGVEPLWSSKQIDSQAQLIDGLPISMMYTIDDVEFAFALFIVRFGCSHYWNHYFRFQILFKINITLNNFAFKMLSLQPFYFVLFFIDHIFFSYIFNIWNKRKPLMNEITNIVWLRKPANSRWLPYLTDCKRK